MELSLPLKVTLQLLHVCLRTMSEPTFFQEIFLKEQWIQFAWWLQNNFKLLSKELTKRVLSCSVLFTNFQKNEVR